MTCPCANCRTSKCGCPECSDGPGIDFRDRHRLHDDVMTAVARERLRVRDLRAPNLERERVRRWGEITTWAREEQDKIDEENEETT
jgi:hypothetical protein